MFKQVSFPKWLSAAALSLSLFAAVPLVSAAAEAVPAAGEPAVIIGSSNHYPLFLQEKFGLTLAASTTKGQFINDLALVLQYQPTADAVTFSDVEEASPYYDAAAALSQRGILTGSDIHPDQPLSVFQAVFIALKAADLKELAYTYPEAKTAAALDKLHLTIDAFQSLSAAQEVAAAVDSGLVPPSLYNQLKPGTAASKTFLEELLGQVLATKGLYEHYIGRVNDPDIYMKLIDAYNASDVIEAPELESVVNGALEQGLVTGYNLKDARYNPNFIDSLTITYGHSDIKHAVQLTGLLRSEGLQAKVQFEPKTSAFVHLLEWGEPEPDLDNHYKKLDNGNYIASAKEYDISFEFNSAADKERFQPIVLAYAKKDSENQSGLIAGSWWQPLYYSQTELDHYDVITNNKIFGSGYYYAQSFSLNSQSGEIVNGFKSIAPAIDITTSTFWVDRPFFSYLSGEDFK
ncbi:S-layer homology domain-containing protein [Paenibacillus nasutitermitis]|uniref:SLH domain-containing protein n=1 Tax=Paenibacillus nasutitermitis TaxID=1652958 RepID=A0A916ZBG8_9BACL|nr:S-layer homology domain-containing protein [Paenibacillus nasutitermitis]GGD84439.1 hypothetical protein GCM10010911_48430 [Paenibacillus nasutitermitis]